MLPVTAAIPTPPTTPRVWAMASIPPTRPRRPSGTWSGTAAVTAAYIAFRKACTPHQPSIIIGTESATDSTSSDSEPPAAPTRIHGSRRPIRSVVRSENAPNSGLHTVETNAPTPSTQPSTCSLCSGEISRACSASSTWIGPNQPDMIAEVHQAQRRPPSATAG